MNVLFLCTGNSARSLIAEAVMNDRARGRVSAFSAGSRPKRKPHSVAIETLEASGYPTAGLRSKSWDEFTGGDSMPLDLVITLCDSAASELCPVWPGTPEIRHWSLPDPASVDEIDACRSAFATTLASIEHRTDAFLKEQFHVGGVASS